MTLKYVVVGAIITTLLTSGLTVEVNASMDNRSATDYTCFFDSGRPGCEPVVYTAENITAEIDKPDFATNSKQDRPAINPDFDPDESCDFNTFQLKCIPGSEQDCPEGFWSNEDYTCHLSGDCPEGYHGVDDDETGQCYPNSEPCPGGFDYPTYVFEEGEAGESDNCEALHYLCHGDVPRHSKCDAISRRVQKAVWR